MKKILLVLIVLGGGYYYFQGNGNETLSVSELTDSSSTNKVKVVEVTGEVKSNFKLIYSIYELKDPSSGESIMVSSKGELPKVGTTITRRLKKNDVVTINDKTFSLYEEVE
jgi:hypothetical protein